MTALATFALLFLMGPSPARSQDDAAIVQAIVEQLQAMQSREDFSDGFLIREGFFPLSRDDLRRTLEEPVREWTDAEREAIVATAEEKNIAVRLCRSGCGERTETGWSVALGVPEHTSQQVVVVPLQLAGSHGTSSWHTAYAFTLAQRPRGRWSVIDVWPGVSSHAESLSGVADTLSKAISCPDSLPGSNCPVTQQLDPDTLPISAENDDYAGEVVGALIGGVVSFYGLGILGGGGSLLAIIPGALIGMGIGSMF